MQYNKITLTKKEVQHIANLARIGLTDEEIGKYQKDLSSILEYFKQLEEVDTEGVEPIGHITGVVNRYRVDKVKGCGAEEREQIMQNLPGEKDGYIKVKSIL